MKLRKALYREGIRGYRIHSKKIFGCPDIAFGKYKVVVFIDGCFWHGCHECNKEPKQSSFWKNKILKNHERDLLVDQKLKESGWHVVRFWEHEVKYDLFKCVSIIKKLLMTRRVPA